MLDKLQPIRGMKDLLPEQYQPHANIINISESVGTIYGYQTIETPILEYSSVFARTLGEASDVVNKEMYSFLDRSDDSITLRPEFTASIMRAFISNGLHHQLPLRFFSSGPVFRYDRPQAGRQRQFHQVNFEYLGAYGPYTDAETLKLAQTLLKELGISEHITLELNSLGCGDSRTNYAKALYEYFSSYKNDLSEESKIRLEKNPMRILDSKSEQDQKLVAEAPIITKYYSPEAREYFDNVLNFLEVLNVQYKLNNRLVRGLDYYSHTAFEFTTDKLGAQAAVGGGGRYDGLSKIMGGPPELPAIGFALGIERIALLQQGYQAKFARPIVIVPIGDENLEHAVKLVDKLREAGKYALLEHRGKLAKKMQNADKVSASHTVLIGSDEIMAGKYKLRSMSDGVEKMVTEKELVEL